MRLAVRRRTERRARRDLELERQQNILEEQRPQGQEEDGETRHKVTEEG